MPGKPQVTAKIGADASDLQKGLASARSQFSRLGKDLASSLRSSLSTGMKLGLGGLAVGMAATLKSGISQAISTQVNAVSMKAMLGSTEELKKAMAGIRFEFEKNPMFNKSDLMEAGTALASFADKSGVKLHGMLRLSEKLSMLKPKAGLMGAAEALRDALGGETERLKEFGFSTKELAGLKAGGGGAAMMQGLNATLIGKGITDQLLQAQGQTAAGVFAQMKNQFAGLSETMGMAFLPDLQELAAGISLSLKENTPKILSGVETIGFTTQMIYKLLEKTLGVFDSTTKNMASLVSGERETTALEKGLKGVPAIGDLVRALEMHGKLLNNSGRAELGSRTRDMLGSKELQARLRVDVQAVGTGGVSGVMAST